MYTGSGRMSLCLVKSYHVTLHVLFVVGITNEQERERPPKSLMSVSV